MKNIKEIKKRYYYRKLIKEIDRLRKTGIFYKYDFPDYARTPDAYISIPYPVEFQKIADYLWKYKKL